MTAAQSNSGTASQNGREAVVDVAIVGAGFAGLYMLYRARELGLTARVYEAGSGVGGTWFWNRYPGARCDIESAEYSYSFSEELQQEWKWPDRYATQPMILSYLNHVADRFDLRRDIQLNTRVTSAIFEEGKGQWLLETDRGDRLRADFCVMATGCLSAPKKLDFAGMEQYRGGQYFTANWPMEGVDFRGQRVGVVGTGSSGIQCIPQIAKQAKHLYVFQRTPNFSIPAWNRAVTPQEERALKDNYGAYRDRVWNSDTGVVGLAPAEGLATSVAEQERRREFEARWNYGGIVFYSSYRDILVDPSVNAEAAEFARDKIRQKVKDPSIAEKLCPKGYPFGTKRLCADTEYYETYNRENVRLVDIRETPIETFTPTGLRTTDASFDLDSVVFATGFDALTGAVSAIDIRGRGGITMRDAWAAGPRNYLGIMTAGFPNMFMTTGPGSCAVLFNMVAGNEHHVRWIADAIMYLRKSQARTIEATREAEDSWTEHVREVGDQTLFPQANSWYVGANIPGKPRVILLYLGGFRAYSKKCSEVAESGYPGFAIA